MLPATGHAILLLSTYGSMNLRSLPLARFPAKRQQPTTVFNGIQCSTLPGDTCSAPPVPTSTPAEAPDAEVFGMYACVYAVIKQRRGGGGIPRHLATAQRSAGSASKTDMGWDQRSPTRSPTQFNGPIACLVHSGLTGEAPTQNVEVSTKG